MLNSETINKIAAGEVIIRPVSVIKELVENAMDAGATRITIELEAGGKNSMVVRDNGCGISYDEVPLAFKRHATSKLTRIEDLEKIVSLGFRGEALSSIAAVAKVQIKTSYKNEDIGSFTQFEGGELVNQRVSAYGMGTEIKVWDLFYNTPARRKHLEKDKKEEMIVRDLLEKLALSNPKIALTLIIDGKNVFSTFGTGLLIDVVSILYGEEIASRLIPVDYKNSPMTISGFIGDITTTRSHREDQIFFINGRYIKNSRLAQTFDDAYEGYMMKHKHPFGIVFLELPGNMLDVNIHPAKTDIKILNESLVLLLFKQGIRETLRNADLSVNVFSSKTKQKSEAEDVAFIESSSHVQRFEDKGFQEPVIENSKINEKKRGEKKEEILTFSEKPLPSPYEEKQEVIEKIMIRESKTLEWYGEENKKKERIPRPDFTKMKIIGQLFQTYLLLEDQDEILLIDQHAAHEAFLTQELLEVFSLEKEMLSQLLLTPITVKLRPKELERVERGLPFYKKMGYQCDIFGENALIVRSVPILLGEPQNQELLIEIINEDIEADDLMEVTTKGIFSKEFKDRIISKACKAAVKGKQKLSSFEIQALLGALYETDNPYTCPHGRPIITKLKEYDLMKLFKRVV
ncbi:MAG: DNA mismatch repair endonuclease MutL [Eubacteriaceae bacterium]